MNTTPNSKKPMSRDEVNWLIELIQLNSIIISKTTNAATNKQKEDAWAAVTSAFNSKCGGFPRGTPQLKLKWDNLKKAARKRTQAIRLNNLKTGGGKADFIPPDEVLEQVAGILGATCTGFEVPFGGDGIKASKRKRSDSETEETVENGALPPTVSQCDSPVGVCDAPSTVVGCATPPSSSSASTGATFLYGMPTMSRSLRNKAEMMSELRQIKSFVTFTMRKVEAIESSIMKMNLSPEPESSNLPYFPLMELSQIKTLEGKLADESIRKELFNMLKYTGGSKERDCVNRCIEKIFSDYLAQYCSWTGKKNNFKLSSLTLMTVIKRAVMHTFPSITDESFERHVMNWFQHATTRLKRQN